MTTLTIIVNSRSVNDWPTDAYSDVLRVTIKSSNGFEINSDIEIVKETGSVDLNQSSDKNYAPLAKRKFKYGEDSKPFADLIVNKIYEVAGSLREKDQVTFSI